MMGCRKSDAGFAGVPQGPDLSSCLQVAQGIPSWLLTGLPAWTLLETILCYVGSALQ